MPNGWSIHFYDAVLQLSVHFDELSFIRVIYYDFIIFSGALPAKSSMMAIAGLFIISLANYYGWRI